MICFEFLNCVVGPPIDFQPIPDYLPGKGVHLPRKALVGCDCSLVNMTEVDAMHHGNKKISLYPCWENRKHGCCAVRAGSMPPYDKYKRLMVPPGHPVYECNSL